MTKKFSELRDAIMNDPVRAARLTKLTEEESRAYAEELMRQEMEGEEEE